MPPTVLIATDDDLKTENAKLKAMHEEDETKAKKAENDHKEEVAKLKAADSYQEPGPVVKAIIAGMDEDHKKEAKARAIKAMDDEEDEVAKASMKKAITDVFETGNGVNTNAEETEKEKEQTAQIASLTARAAKPIIHKILTAKQLAGATEDQLTTETKRLSTMTLTAVEAEYESNAVFIEKALVAAEIPETESLIASEERGFEFNGHSGALVGNAINIDECVEAAHL